MFDFTDLFLRNGFLCPCGQCDHQPALKTITRLLLSRSPQRNSLEPSEPCLRNLHLHRNPPEPASGTYSTHRNSPEPASRNLPPEPTPVRAGTLHNFRNLHQHTPKLAGTFRNLPPKPTPVTEIPGTLRHSAQLSRTLQNLPLEPTPAHSLRNLLLRPATAHTGAYLG